MLGEKTESPEINIHAVRPGHAAYRASTILLLILILAVSVGLRVKDCLGSAGLLHDDTLLASNIIRHDDRRLLEPLDREQAAPVGYLLLMKQATRTLGISERSLRIPSLTASILALLMAVPMLARILSPTGQLIGVAILGLSTMLIYYSASLKQYSGDVLVSVVLLSAGFYAIKSQSGAGRFVILGVLGFLSLFFSQPSSFMLGGIGLTLILSAIFERRPREALAWVVVASIWLGTFLGLYLLIYKQYTKNAFLATFWAQNFAPFPPRSPEQLKWYGEAFFGMFASALGLKFSGLAGVLFLWGGFQLRWNGRGRELSMLILPLLLAVMASALKAYPFGDRLLLFTAPILAALLASGLVGLLGSPIRGGRVILALSLGTLLLYPSYAAVKVFRSGPDIDHDIKPALAYVSKHYQDGDEIYLNCDAVAMTDYYRDVIHFEDTQRLPFYHGHYAGAGVGLPAEIDFYEKDLEPLWGKKRVWVVFAMGRQNYEPIFEYVLKRHGVLVDSFQGGVSTAFLWDLSSAKPPQIAREPR